MGVGAGLYMCDVVKKFTFTISSPDEFLYIAVVKNCLSIWEILFPNSWSQNVYVISHLELPMLFIGSLA